MDINDILSLGAKAFSNSDKSGDAGSALSGDVIQSALSSLTGGDFNIASLLGGMQSGGLASIAQSWLGNGENKSISSEGLMGLLGDDKVSAFASQLGVSKDEAIGGLQDALPKMVDNASSDGSLLDSIGGMKGIMGLASKFF
jgi:uncharacterized protein YidB (DUF937 family)